MTINSHTAGPDTRHAATASISLSKMAHGIVSMLARIGGKAHSAMKTLQMPPDAVDALEHERPSACPDWFPAL